MTRTEIEMSPGMAVPAPKVSIIIPLHNDEDFVAGALDSCLAQTLPEIEIICIDDASDDATAQVVATYQSMDQRVKLIRFEQNRSAFQARLAGINAATAPYAMFLDGDDELAPNAVERAFSHAVSQQADIVGFGVLVVMPDGSTGGRFENSLQPKHRELFGEEIAPTVFRVGEVAQGHLWRNLYKTALLQHAYQGLPEGVELYRANDMPITFRAFAAAKHYYSIRDRLYRYNFRRGISGQRVDSYEKFDLYLSAIDSIETIREAIEAEAAGYEIPGNLLASYESARRSIIGNVLNICARDVARELRDECLERLCARVGELDAILGAAEFAPDSLDLLSRRAATRVPELKNPRSVMLFNGNLHTGGVQGVLVSQAHFLVDAGFEVTICVEGAADSQFELPDSVELRDLSQHRSLADRMAALAEICAERQVDVVINHHVLYQERWPYYAIAVAALGIPTIGWLHNFALRTLMDFTTRGTFLRNHLPILSKTVVLSATDVAFWKLRGVPNAVYLPNPPSPLVLDAPVVTRTAPQLGETIELVWWGRLQQSTKQVRQLIDLAAELKARDLDFRLTIIGPESKDLSQKTLREDAARRSVADNVRLLGPLHGQDLVDELAAAHMHVSTSLIEGFPLALCEAQALGLPIAMYELPWLAILPGNEGISSAPQGDVIALADRVCALMSDPGMYDRASESALLAAKELRSVDFSTVYTELLEGRLPTEYSPEPTTADASLLLDLAFFYSDINVRAQARHRRRLEASMKRREEAVEPAEQMARLYGQMKSQQREMDRLLKRIPVDPNGARLAKLQRQNEALRRSRSFRIGRLVTYIPRKIARLAAR